MQESGTMNHSSTVNKLVRTILVLLVFHISWAQPPMRLFDWAEHIPINAGTYVTQSPTNIIYASGASLVLIDKATRDYQTLSKTTGLSDVGIKFVKYDVTTSTLIIVYENSNIDLITEGRIRNFSQIRNNPNIVGDKTIFDLALNGDGRIYFACGFGLVELNLNRREFGFTTFTSGPVRDFAALEDWYYMATDNGLFRVNFRTNSNLADFGRWENVVIDNLPANQAISELAVFNGMLYIGVQGRIFRGSTSGNFNQILERNDAQLIFLSNEASKLLLGWNCSGCPNTIQYLNDDLSVGTINNFCTDNPRYAIESSDGSIWIGDLNNDFRIGSISMPQMCERISINSIYSGNISDIATRGDRVYVASGGFQPNSSNRFREDGFFIYEDNTWSAYNKFNIPIFNSRDIRDFLRVRLHPREDTLFVGTYYDGIIKWVDSENFTIYDETNSSLRRGVGDPNRIRVAGMAWDNDGHLWVGQFDGPRPIHVYRKDGSWRSFGVSGSNNLMDVIIDRSGNKWFRVFNGGVLVFNEGNDIDSEADDRFRSFTSTNSTLPANSVTCLALDQDGSVWVGTENGIALFNCGSDPFNPACRGSESFLEQDGFGAILLEGQNITTIAVDGGNRKWIGTNAGLFVQSPTGDQAIFNFTTNNSPLMDNAITAIHIDDRTGIVYIGTSRGIQMFKAEATGATGSFQTEVYAYPNPVRPDYDGPIVIKGLARDANFKVTDIEGRLVFEGRAIGGQAIWDGRDFNGRKAKTGVYLVFATFTGNLDFPATHVTKLVFVD